MIASIAHVIGVLGELPNGPAAATADFAAEGLSPVAVAVDHQVIAVAGIGDPLRADSAQSVSAIRDDGWRVEILSGDHPTVVASIAGQVGIETTAARGGIAPEQKLEVVRTETEEETTAMVGDGVNDAAALAAATVGIGVHGGAEAALAAADVYLARPGLAPVVELLDGARKTLGVIRRNLVFSLTYNVIAVSFAITGNMSPLLAAILITSSG